MAVKAWNNFKMGIVSKSISAIIIASICIRHTFHAIFLERLMLGGGWKAGEGEGMPSGARPVWPGRSWATPASLCIKNYKMSIVNGNGDVNVSLEA